VKRTNKSFLLYLVVYLFFSLILSGCGGEEIVEDRPPAISQVNSSAFSDRDNVYKTGSVVRIDVKEQSGATDVTSGTIQIKSASQAYDSGVQNLTLGSIFYNWDTTGLNPASDYTVEVKLTDAAGQTATNDSLVLILTENPPAINKLVSVVDISVPARGLPVRILRTYLLDSGFEGPLGFGWTHTYLMHIVETADGLVKVFNLDGSGSFFHPNGDGSYDSPKGDFRTLTKNPDGTFELREKFGTLFSFDAGGKLTSIEDRNGNSLTMNYNAGGLLETIIDASEQTTTFTYDTNNRVVSITDPAERAVFYNYDSAGNLTSVKNIGEFTTNYVYDDEHNLTTVTDPAGRRTFYTSDVDDRLETISDEEGNNSLSFQYSEPSANEMTITDALGDKIIFTYDNNALITKVTDPLGNANSLTYDDDFNLTSLTDANGNLTRFTYDNRGNILTMTDAQGNIIKYTYEALLNQITSIIDTKENTTSFDYDGNGNLITITFPDGSKEKYAYDIFGNLVSKTDRMNQTINFNNDSRGMLIEKSFPDGSFDRFTYDDAGNLLSAADENGMINFSYDSLDRIIKVAYPGGEAVSCEYESASRRTKLIYPDGTILNYVYDEVNRLTEVSNSVQAITRYTYDKLSRVTRRDLANGTFSTYSYDQSSQLLDLINRKSTAEIISRFSYSYDSVGNRLTLTTLEGTTQYTYDAVNQLVNVILPDGSTKAYDIDSIGNRISITDSGGVTNYTANNLNQYTNVGGDAYTYDSNGNLKSKTTPYGTTIYTYDYENCLIRVDTPTETITYTYDPFGRRISKTTSAGTKNYIYDGFRVIMEKDDIGTVEASYIYGIGIDEVLVMKRDGVDYFYSQDGLGSVTDITDISENIVESFSYDSYGMPSKMSSVGNPYLYTGREFESEAGLYHYRKRYYDPTLGRFIGVDPIGFSGGINLYTYTSNNPTVFIDSFGLLQLSRRKIWDISLELFSDLLSLNNIPYGSSLLAINNLTKYAEKAKAGEDVWWPEVTAEALKGILGVLAATNPYFAVAQRLVPAAEMAGFIAGDICERYIKPIIVRNTKSGDPTFVQLSLKEIKSHENIKLKSKASNGIFAKLSVPYPNSLVRGNVPIFGLAYGKNFKEYRVEYGQGKEPTEWITIAKSTTPQTEDVTPEDLDVSADITIRGNLATWDTGLRNYVYLPSHPKDHPINLKGVYTLRLLVVGEDDSAAEDRVTVEVGNVIPNAWGGIVRSTDNKVTLTVAEQSIMDSFRIISIKPIDTAPVSLPLLRQLIGHTYEFREAGEKFTKEAVLGMEFSNEDVVGKNLNQLGIYTYSPEKQEWEYLQSSRHEKDNKIFVRVRELNPYYCLAASDIPDEGSILEKWFHKEEQIKEISIERGIGRYLFRNTFEDGMDEWSNRDGEVGAEVSLDNIATFDGSYCLKLTNKSNGGNLASNVRRTPFDVREYPLVQFDYKISPDVKINFFVKVNGRWYEIGFTDDYNEYKHKRVNISNIGKIEGVIRDSNWHTARFNLHEMLRTKTKNYIVEEIVMADWDLGGYMKLEFGANNKGATYFIDNFSIIKEISPSLKIDNKILLIDNFNSRKDTNLLGGISATFTDSEDGKCQISFEEEKEESTKKGHSLKISYDVSKTGSFAGYLTQLENLDLREYQVLAFTIRGSESKDTLKVGLKDSSGNENKVSINGSLPQGITEAWQEVKIPLAAFFNIKKWNSLENLSFSIEYDPECGVGEVFLDDIQFRKELMSFVVNDFETESERNSLGGESWTFSNGPCAVNADYDKSSSNNAYWISYGGSIGDLFAYAGWTTQLNGIDVSQCNTLSFLIKGAEGGEEPNIYLDDGTHRWPVKVKKYSPITTSWQMVTIPLKDFADCRVDLTHLEELQIVFEWKRMSGTVYIDDIQFNSSLGGAEER